MHSFGPTGVAALLALFVARRILNTQLGHFQQEETEARDGLGQSKSPPSAPENLGAACADGAVVRPFPPASELQA